MSPQEGVVEAITRRLGEACVAKLMEAIVLELVPDSARGFDRELTVVIPLAHLPAQAPSGDSTHDNIAKWLLRDLGEEADVKSDARFFFLERNAEFVGLQTAARDEL